MNAIDKSEAIEMVEQLVAEFHERVKVLKSSLRNAPSIEEYLASIDEMTDIEIPSELERCPFCGGVAEMFETPHVPRGTDYTPRCKNTSCCGRLTKKWADREKAILAWNMRRNVR